MKSGSTRKLLLATLLVLLSSGAAFAEEDIPVRNWTVPIYSLDGLGKAVDATDPRAFIGVQPCRVVDTRGNGAPIVGGIFAGPADVRNWDIDGICGIPNGVDAVSVNFTVVGPAAAGFLVAWPTGGPVPPVSILNYTTGQTVANAAIVPVSSTGSITVNVSASTHVLMDVNGYFSDQLDDPTNFFRLINNSTSYTAYFQNLSTTCGGACGVYQTVAGATAIAFYGVHTPATGVGRGVHGESNSASTNTAGVRGLADASTGATYGVWGETDSSDLASAGVLGLNGTVFPSGGTVNPANWFSSAGVRAVTGVGRGVVSIASGTSAVSGTITDSAGNLPATGHLGLESGGTRYAGYFSGATHVQGTFTATTKLFVEPHPLDPAKQINYVSLEGRKSEIYYRGTASIAQGLTHIDVPEDFRLTARPGSYSTLVTPVGEMATVAVISEDASGIVVRASRNVRIHYVVYAERNSHRDHEPITANVNFRPDAEGDFDVTSLPESYRQIMMQTGLLNADGTVNASKARELGWKLKSEAERDMQPSKAQK